MTFREVAKARGVLDGLNLAQMIDVVDMNSISEERKESVFKEGILWKD